VPTRPSAKVACTNFGQVIFSFACTPSHHHHHSHRDMALFSGKFTSPAMMNLEEKREEALFKVLVVGDIGAGKTAIIRRAVDNIFSETYKSTIGVDFALKSIEISPKVTAWLQLWDIAGQERYGNLTRVYYREAVAALVVFDLARPDSFEATQKWKNDIDAKVTLPNGDPIPVVLVANKCDLVNSPLNEAFMDQYCKDHGFVSWITTSAKKDINITETINSITKHAVARFQPKARDDEEDEHILLVNEGRSYSCCWS